MEDVVIVDAYAWIEFFRGSEAGKKLFDLIEKKTELVTPTMVIAELSFKYIREKNKFYR